MSSTEDTESNFSRLSRTPSVSPCRSRNSVSKSRTPTPDSRPSALRVIPLRKVNEQKKCESNKDADHMPVLTRASSRTPKCNTSYANEDEQEEPTLPVLKPEIKRKAPASEACNTLGPSCNFQEDQEVLVRWNDGLFYLGNIVKVDEKQRRCYVKFEDDSMYWALYKDIQKGPNQDEIHCCVCQGETSETPNEIVLCDHCGLGYHQACHNPPIESSVLQPDVPWLCRQCVFAATAKIGGAVKKGPNARALQVMKQTLPYDLNSLHWDNHHKINAEKCYCYCGGPGDWYMKMLQCCRCRQWFHEACIQCLEYPLMYGDRFYIFVCSFCNSGPEYIKRLQLKWVDVVQLALFNLTIRNNKKYYDFEEELMPVIMQNWERMQLTNLETTTRLEKMKIVLDTLQGNKTRFACGKEIKKKVTLWGLRLRVPPPAPTVILPEDGQITDEVMNNLQMKGRKTKTFVPYHSTSPIPLRHPKSLKRKADEDLLSMSKKARKLLINATTKDVVRDAYSNNQEYKGYKGNMDIYDFHDEEDDIGSYNNNPGSDTTSQSALDLIIPRPSSYEGSNHPFKTVLERDQEIERKKLKAEILDWYQHGYMDADQDVDSEIDFKVNDNENEQENGFTHLCENGYHDTSVSEKSLDLNEPVKKKRGRKSNAEKRRLHALEEQRRREKEHSTKQRLMLQRRNATSSYAVKPVKINGISKSSINMNHIRNNVSNYFGAADRLASGEQFEVLARRVNPDGKVQYLVQWGGIVA